VGVVGTIIIIIIIEIGVVVGTITHNAVNPGYDEPSVAADAAVAAVAAAVGASIVVVATTGRSSAGV
jgi:hypothetical protein